MQTTKTLRALADPLHKAEIEARAVECAKAGLYVVVWRTGPMSPCARRTYESELELRFPDLDRTSEVSDEDAIHWCVSWA